MIGEDSDAHEVGLDEALEALRSELAMARTKAAASDIQRPTAAGTHDINDSGVEVHAVRHAIPNLKHRRPSPPLAVAVAAFVVALAGVASATIPDRGGVIHACYAKASRLGVRLIDTGRGQRCALTEVALNWNQKGPRGNAGPKGDTGAQGPGGLQGPQGDPGPGGAGALFANVAFDGRLVNGKGAVSVAGFGNPTTGTYRVTFNRNVSQCAPTVSGGGSEGTGDLLPASGLAFVGGPTTNAVDVIFVRADSTLVDANFHLVVTC